ncbi:MAG: hypothetical protein GY795_17665, partial [Desulfobacterales bacterium]|nr:hypothetical protein [Desulfobacterales bacterium]
VNGGIGLMSLVASGNKTSCSVKSVPCNSVLKQQSEDDNFGYMPEESIVGEKTCLLRGRSQGDKPGAQDTVFPVPTGDGAESSVPLTNTREIVQSNAPCKTERKIEATGSPVKTCVNLQLKEESGNNPPEKNGYCSGTADLHRGLCAATVEQCVRRSQSDKADETEQKKPGLNPDNGIQSARRNANYLRICFREVGGGDCGTPLQPGEKKRRRRRRGKRKKSCSPANPAAGIDQILDGQLNNTWEEQTRDEEEPQLVGYHRQFRPEAQVPGKGSYVAQETRESYVAQDIVSAYRSNSTQGEVRENTT